MKTKTLLLTAAAGAFVVSAANADFVGGSLEMTHDDGPDGNWTWRVYVDFDDTTDVLLAVGGIPGLAPVVFTADGGGLVNDGGVFAGLKTEDFPAGAFTGERDSWVSIGSNLGFPNPTDYSPGFAGSDDTNSIIKGNSWSDENGGWFNGTPGTVVDGGHILIAQFTLASGDDFTLSGLANWQVGSPEGFTSSFFSVTTVPAPGALALLGLAGVAGRRRRR